MPKYQKRQVFLINDRDASKNVFFSKSFYSLKWYKNLYHEEITPLEGFSEIIRNVPLYCNTESIVYLKIFLFIITDLWNTSEKMFI